MKLRLLIAVLVVISVLIISGCAGKLPAEEEEGAEEAALSEEALETKELIEKLSKEAGLTEDGEAEDAETTKELLEKLSKEAGLTEDEEAEEEEEEEEAEEEEVLEPQEYTIAIEMFVGFPEDLTIAQGSSVTWINEHPNFMHIIGIRPKLESGKYDEPITEKNEIFENATFTFTFEDPGIYQWYSATKYPESSGIITVTAIEETEDNETEEE